MDAAIDRAALVEQIARRIAQAEYGDNVDDVWRTCEEEASAVADLALGAAAAICDRRAAEVWKSDWEPVRKACYEDAAELIRDMMGES